MFVTRKRHGQSPAIDVAWRGSETKKNFNVDDPDQVWLMHVQEQQIKTGSCSSTWEVIVVLLAYGY